MRKEIEIQTKSGLSTINQNNLFIIAEVGNQFNGKYETALELARVAKEAGADAVKYIFWFPDEIMADKSLMYSYETAEGIKTEPMFDLLNRLRLPLHEWVDLKYQCDELGIIMTTTVNCFSAFDYALDLGLPIIKLSSWDWNFTDLWRMCARTMLPCIADMSPVSEQEAERNVKIFEEEGNKDLLFLHCFHTKQYDQMNILTIPYLRDKFDCLVGYSSADYNDETDIMAVAMRACVLEKRLTLDRHAGVLHDALSKEPDEFKSYVKQMRGLHSALGICSINQSDNDWAERKKWFRRVVTDVPIGKGDDITREMLECKRGEDGFPAERIWELVGKKAKKDMPRNFDIDLRSVE